MRVPVSAVVLAYNEELNIEACLGSVAGWVDEIVVVDSGSTDRTVELARRYADRIVEHEYIDHASQWRWVFESLTLANDWVLALDADNIVSERLKQQIAGVLEQDDPEIGGYYSVHAHYFRNRRTRGFKKHSLRLVRRSRTTVDDAELVDFRFVVEGRTRTLSGEMRESNQNELAIDFWIDKHQRFAWRMAVEECLRRSGHLGWRMQPRLLGNHDERMLWFKSRWYRGPLYLRPFLYFFYRFVLRGGFLDGRNGLVYHVMQALWFRLLVDIRIAELEQGLRDGRVSVDELRAAVR